jgi:hypothetical protein
MKPLRWLTVSLSLATAKAPTALSHIIYYYFKFLILENLCKYLQTVFYDIVVLLLFYNCQSPRRLV